MREAVAEKDAEPEDAVRVGEALREARWLREAVADRVGVCVTVGDAAGRGLHRAVPRTLGTPHPPQPHPPPSDTPHPRPLTTTPTPSPLSNPPTQ